MNREVPTEGFLKFMRDQGAQRAYRNVLEWFRTMTILDAVGKINSEILMIDARRDAFRRVDKEKRPEKEDKWPNRQDRDLKETLKRSAAEAKKQLSRRKPKGSKRLSRRRTR